jgi:glucan phosphoethanolaminetransferase (alkaline phosphatase superfamily)
MIQRIQSIFLLLAAGCGFGVLAAPFATTPQTVAASTLFSDANYAATDSPALLALFAVAGALALGGIFLFNNRQLQMKVCRFAIIANVLGLVLTIVLLWQDNANYDFNSIRDGVSAYLPFGFLLFGFLALRFIRKDESLVRSMDRLR